MDVWEGIGSAIDFTACDPYNGRMPGTPLAIIAALDDEIRPILDAMSVDERLHVRPARFVRGTYRKHSLVLGRSGMGPVAMERAIATCLTTYRPACCLHVGCCGAADPELSAGDLVIASSLIDVRHGQRVSAPEQLLARAEKLVQERELRYRVGNIVTVDSVISTPHEKADYGAEHGALAIDMESAVFALACARASVPWLVVRAVFDPLDTTLPSLSGALDEAGNVDYLGLADYLMHHPSDVLKLPKLRYLAEQSREAITAFIHAWIGEELV